MAALLQPFIDRRLIAGGVTLAATKDKILSFEAAGSADLATRRPMREDTMFWIASQTKPITATALMMLADEGKIRIDDPVEKYLLEFQGQMVIAEQDDDHILLKKPAHPILVREILTHTAGLAFASPLELRFPLDQLDLADAVRSHAMSPLLSEPGTCYLYSNGGINTAGRIIEVISGMAYADFLDERLFHPLGMTDTTFWPSSEQVARLAQVYQSKASGLEKTSLEQLSHPLTNRRRQPMPAGGLFSTAADVAKFCQMILRGGETGGKRYVSEAAIRQMTSNQTSVVVQPERGLGWAIDQGNFGHGGACRTNMTINPRLGLIMIFLVQQAGEWASEEGGKILPTFQAAAEKLLS